MTTRTRQDAAALDAAVPEVILHRGGVYERLGKRVLDVTVGSLLLLLATPVLLAVALAVRIKIGSPVLFRQPRVGRGGQVFSILKFRTMLPDRRNGGGHEFVGADRRVTHKTPRDPRHTRLGRLLRRTSLDELPQLWQVVTGDLSLVGPRPEMVDIVASRYQPWQHRRHAVRPGLTGLWQVTERDDHGLMFRHVDTDLAYVDAMTFWLDLRILARTVPILLGARPRPLTVSSVTDGRERARLVVGGTGCDDECSPAEPCCATAAS